MIAILCCAVVPLCCATGPDSFDQRKLAEMLSKSELNPPFQGTLEFASYIVEYKIRKDYRRVARYRYRFICLADSELIEVHNRIYDGWYPRWLICKNERYYFKLARGANGWILLDVQKRDRLRDDSRIDFEVFRKHFSDPNRIGTLLLRQVLQDGRFDLTVAQYGRRLYEVKGRPRKDSGMELARFRATVVVSKNGECASVGRSLSVFKKPDGTTVEIKISNRVGDDGGRPRIVESVKVTSQAGDLREIEDVRSFEIEPTSSESVSSRFYLSHYGFPEPVFGDPTEAPVTNRYAWFLGLLLAAVVAYVVARNIRRQPSSPSAIAGNRTSV